MAHSFCQTGIWELLGWMASGFVFFIGLQSECWLGLQSLGFDGAEMFTPSRAGKWVMSDGAVPC